MTFQIDLLWVGLRPLPEPVTYHYWSFTLTYLLLFASSPRSILFIFIIFLTVFLSIFESNCFKNVSFFYLTKLLFELPLLSEGDCCNIEVVIFARGRHELQEVLEAESIEFKLFSTILLTYTILISSYSFISVKSRVKKLWVVPVELHTLVPLSLETSVTISSSLSRLQDRKCACACF